MQFVFIEGCLFTAYYFIGGELGEVLFNCFGNLLNDIWRVFRFGIYVLDYVIWFLVGSLSAVVQLKSDIQIVYYFHITLYNYVQTIGLKYFL